MGKMTKSLFGICQHFLSPQFTTSEIAGQRVCCLSILPSTPQVEDTHFLINLSEVLPPKDEDTQTQLEGVLLGLWMGAKDEMSVNNNYWEMGHSSGKSSCWTGIISTRKQPTRCEKEQDGWPDSVQHFLLVDHRTVQSVPVLRICIDIKSTDTGVWILAQHVLAGSLTHRTSVSSPVKWTDNRTCLTCRT